MVHDCLHQNYLKGLWNLHFQQVSQVIVMRITIQDNCSDVFFIWTISKYEKYKILLAGYTQFTINKEGDKGGKICMACYQKLSTKSWHLREKKKILPLDFRSTMTESKRKAWAFYVKSLKRQRPEFYIDIDLVTVVVNIRWAR